jgi:hypothetical protein
MLEMLLTLNVSHKIKPPGSFLIVMDWITTLDWELLVDERLIWHADTVFDWFKYESCFAIAPHPELFLTPASPWIKPNKAE